MDKTNLAVLIGIGIIAAACVGAVVVQTGLVVWQIATTSDAAADLSSTIAELTDEQIDAGHYDPVLRADDPLLNDRKILLFHDVNSRTAKDVSARLQFLNSKDSSRPIDLLISTQGGWLDNAFTIIDTMRTIEAPVNTWAIGGCYSSGALILTAGTGRRYATEDTIIMVHASLDDSSEPYSHDRVALDRYEKVWINTASLPDDWYPMTSDESYYLSAQEAEALGIVDEVVPTWGKRAAPPAEPSE